MEDSAISLDADLKRLRMNGGKTPPLVARICEKLGMEIKRLRGQIDGSTSSKIFWEAVTECHHAGMELSFRRKRYVRTFLAGFCTAWLIVVILAAIFTANGAVLAVHYG